MAGGLAILATDARPPAPAAEGNPGIVGFWRAERPNHRARRVSRYQEQPDRA